jgi:hypothetical protein
VAISDLNGDGHADLIASLRVQGKYGLAIFWGKGDGTFRPNDTMLAWDETSRMALGYIAAADLNGDGLMDIVFSLWNRSVLISLGLGRGEFSKPVPLPGTTESGGPRTFCLGELDLDGKLDLLVADNRTGTLSLYRGNGDGTFAPSISALVGKGVYFFPLEADFNGDGLPDIIVNNYYDKRLELLKADWKRPGH